jgi:uncharacterized protein involved in outer membrane biogenesis
VPQTLLARLLQRRIAAALGTPVRVERWRGSIRHRTVELHGVTAGVEPDAGGSFRISIDRVSASLRLRGLRRPRLVIETLSLERPVVRLPAGGAHPPAASTTIAIEAATRDVAPVDADRRRRLEVGLVEIAGGEVHFVPRTPADVAASVLGITVRVEPGDGALRLDAEATSVTVRGAVLPGISLAGLVTGAAFDLLDSPIEARWTFGALARGTATTSALRTDGVHVEGEARARVADLNALEWLAGVLAPVLRLANDGEIDVTFRGTFGPAGPRLETLSARLELRG